MKGKWRKNPIHVGTGNREKCIICGLCDKFWDGKEFVTYEKEKPCPRCGYKKAK